MAKLTDDHKTFIVTRLAMYDTPTMVAVALKETFGLDVPANQIEGYSGDSHRALTGNIALKWRELFDATRERFKVEVDAIPIANRTFRLRRLNSMFERHTQKGNLVAAAAVLEQAAKESGDVFSNRREHTHKGSVKADVEDGLTTDDKRLALAARIADALAQAAVTKH